MYMAWRKLNEACENVAQPRFELGAISKRQMACCMGFSMHQSRASPRETFRNAFQLPKLIKTVAKNPALHLLRAPHMNSECSSTLKNKCSRIQNWTY